MIRAIPLGGPGLISNEKSATDGIWVRNYLFACEKLGLAKSKMASVEEIRTRISLREHNVINVS